MARIIIKPALESKDQELKTVQDFIEILNLVHANEELLLNFKEKYSDWSHTFNTARRSCDMIKSVAVQSLRPSKVIRIASTTVISLCLLEYCERNMYSASSSTSLSYLLAGLGFYLLIVAMDVTSALWVTFISSPSRYLSDICEYFECIFLMIRLHSWRMRVLQRRMNFCVDECSVLRVDAFSFENANHAKFSCSIFSMFNFYGILIAFLIFALCRYFQYENFALLEIFTISLIITISVSKDVTVLKFSSKMISKRKEMKAIAVSFFSWFDNKCELKRILQEYGVEADILSIVPINRSEILLKDSYLNLLVYVTVCEQVLHSNLSTGELEKVFIVLVYGVYSMLRLNLSEQESTATTAIQSSREGLSPSEQRSALSKPADVSKMRHNSKNRLRPDTKIIEPLYKGRNVLRQIDNISDIDISESGNVEKNQTKSLLPKSIGSDQRALHPEFCSPNVVKDVVQSLSFDENLELRPELKSLRSERNMNRVNDSTAYLYSEVNYENTSVGALVSGPSVSVLPLLLKQKDDSYNSSDSVIDCYSIDSVSSDVIKSKGRNMNGETDGFTVYSSEGEEISSASKRGENLDAQKGKEIIMNGEVRDCIINSSQRKEIVSTIVNENELHFGDCNEPRNISPCTHGKEISDSDTFSSDSRNKSSVSRQESEEIAVSFKDGCIEQNENYFVDPQSIKTFYSEDFPDSHSYGENAPQNISNSSERIEASEKIIHRPDQCTDAISNDKNLNCHHFTTKLISDNFEQAETRIEEDETLNSSNYFPDTVGNENAVHEICTWFSGDVKVSTGAADRFSEEESPEHLSPTAVHDSSCAVKLITDGHDKLFPELQQIVFSEALDLSSNVNNSEIEQQIPFPTRSSDMDNSDGNLLEEFASISIQSQIISNTSHVCNVRNSSGVNKHINLTIKQNVNSENFELIGTSLQSKAVDCSGSDIDNNFESGLVHGELTENTISDSDFMTSTPKFEGNKCELTQYQETVMDIMQEGTQNSSEHNKLDTDAFDRHTKSQEIVKNSYEAEGNTESLITSFRAEKTTIASANNFAGVNINEEMIENLDCTPLAVATEENISIMNTSNRIEESPGILFNTDEVTDRKESGQETISAAVSLKPMSYNVSWETFYKYISGELMIYDIDSIAQREVVQNSPSDYVSSDASIDGIKNSIEETNCALNSSTLDENRKTISESHAFIGNNSLSVDVECEQAYLDMFNSKSINTVSFPSRTSIESEQIAPRAISVASIGSGVINLENYGNSVVNRRRPIRRGKRTFLRSREMAHDIKHEGSPDNLSNIQTVITENEIREEIPAVNLPDKISVGVCTKFEETGVFLHRSEESTMHTSNSISEERTKQSLFISEPTTNLVSTNSASNPIPEDRVDQNISTSKPAVNAVNTNSILDCDSTLEISVGVCAKFKEPEVFLHRSEESTMHTSNSISEERAEQSLLISEPTTDPVITNSASNPIPEDRVDQNISTSKPAVNAVNTNSILYCDSTLEEHDDLNSSVFEEVAETVNTNSKMEETGFPTEEEIKTLESIFFTLAYNGTGLEICNVDSSLQTSIRENIERKESSENLSQMVGSEEMHAESKKLNESEREASFEDSCVVNALNLNACQTYDTFDFSPDLYISLNERKAFMAENSPLDIDNNEISSANSSLEINNLNEGILEGQSLWQIPVSKDILFNVGRASSSSTISCSIRNFHQKHGKETFLDSELKRDRPQKGGGCRDSDLGYCEISKGKKTPKKHCTSKWYKNTVRKKIKRYVCLQRYRVGMTLEEDDIAEWRESRRNRRNSSDGGSSEQLSITEETNLVEVLDANHNSQASTEHNRTASTNQCNEASEYERRREISKNEYVKTWVKKVTKRSSSDSERPHTGSSEDGNFRFHPSTSASDSSITQNREKFHSTSDTTSVCSSLSKNKALDYEFISSEEDENFAPESQAVRATKMASNLASGVVKWESDLYFNKSEDTTGGHGTVLPATDGSTVDEHLRLVESAASSLKYHLKCENLDVTIVDSNSQLTIRFVSESEPTRSYRELLETPSSCSSSDVFLPAQKVSHRDGHFSPADISNIPEIKNTGNAFRMSVEDVNCGDAPRREQILNGSVDISAVNTLDITGEETRGNKEPASGVTIVENGGNPYFPSSNVETEISNQCSVNQGGEQLASIMPQPNENNSNCANRSCRDDLKVGEPVSDRDCQPERSVADEDVGNAEMPKDFVFESELMKINYKPKNKSDSIEVSFRKRQGVTKMTFKSQQKKLYLKVSPHAK